MTLEEIRITVLETLVEIAPEADPAVLRGDIDLREQLDLDSMDFMNFVVAVEARVGVHVPETEYASLEDLDSFVAYIAERLPAPALA